MKFIKPTVSHRHTLSVLITCVLFLFSQPGFVFKSYILPEGKQKLFVNMCMTDTLNPAAATNPVKSSDGKRGENWNIPYSLTPPRDDHDKGSVYNSHYYNGRMCACTCTSDLHV